MTLAKKVFKKKCFFRLVAWIWKFLLTSQNFTYFRILLPFEKTTPRKTFFVFLRTSFGTRRNLFGEGHVCKSVHVNFQCNFLKICSYQKMIIKTKNVLIYLIVLAFLLLFRHVSFLYLFLKMDPHNLKGTKKTNIDVDLTDLFIINSKSFLRFLVWQIF